MHKDGGQTWDAVYEVGWLVLCLALTLCRQGNAADRRRKHSAGTYMTYKCRLCNAASIASDSCWHVIGFKSCPRRSRFLSPPRRSVKCFALANATACVRISKSSASDLLPRVPNWLRLRVGRWVGQDRMWAHCKIRMDLNLEPSQQRWYILSVTHQHGKTIYLALNGRASFSRKTPLWLLPNDRLIANWLYNMPSSL